MPIFFFFLLHPSVGRNSLQFKKYETNETEVGSSKSVRAHQFFLLRINQTLVRFVLRIAHREPMGASKVITRSR